MHHPNSHALCKARHALRRFLSLRRRTIRVQTLGETSVLATPSRSMLLAHPQRRVRREELQMKVCRATLARLRGTLGGMVLPRVRSFGMRSAPGVLIK